MRVTSAAVFASLVLAGSAQAAPSDRYVVRNIMSNNTALIPADRADPLLVNPWGLAASAGSPWWPANYGSNTSTIVNASGTPSTTRANTPRPTGVVAGAGTGNFLITNTPPAVPANAASFIFATLGGQITAWRNGITNNDAIVGIDRSGVGAVYTGLTIATVGGAPRLYAADLRNNRIDMVNAQWGLITAPGAFVDPTLPAGYGAYGVQAVGNRIVVTYAKQPPGNPTPYREIPTGGVVSVFDLNGAFISRVATDGVLQAPWGTAQAASNFGLYGGDLLIGNFGNGRINAFHENPDGTWTNSGFLKDLNGNPLQIGGLWALQFGKGNASSGATNHLYYTAGPFGETAGVVGRIIPNPGDVSGTVPATLSLTMGTPASFGNFVPGVAADYTATTTANVISSAGDATLSVADPSASNTGKLVNGAFALAQPVQVNATSPGGGTGGALTALGGSANPNTLITYTGPISNDMVTVNFKQSIGNTDPLRSGAYSKTLTFTLSTTNP